MSSFALIALLVVLVVPVSGCTRNPDCGFQPSSNSPLIPESFGVNIHFTDPQPGEIKLLADSGVRWVRMDFKWDLTEPVGGRYDFAPYDRLMSELQPFGIRALFILDYGNPLYTGDGPPRTEPARQAFAKWAVAAARHFANRGVLWEIYNEPNNDMFWRPRPNAEEYGALALAVGQAFRREVPRERLIGPAIGEMDFRFMEGCLKAGLLEYVSAVSVHPYLRSDPENVASEYCRLRDMIKSHSNNDVPIISSEWGYSAVWRGQDEEKQGQLLARQWLTNVANGIELSVWYDWRDDGSDANDPEHHFGMVSHTYKPKPAYLAAKTLTTFFNGYRFEKRLKMESWDDYLLVFRNGDKVRFAAWTTAAEHDAVLPLDAGEYSGTGHTGEKNATVKGGEKGLNIRLTRAPIYLSRITSTS